MTEAPCDPTKPTFIAGTAVPCINLVVPPITSQMANREYNDDVSQERHDVWVLNHAGLDGAELLVDGNKIDFDAVAEVSRKALKAAEEFCKLSHCREVKKKDNK
jgi:hypothetical protein